MSEQDEKLLALIDACLKREEKAWEVFVSQYGKVVRGYLSRHFWEKPDKIDDVTQQVFIKLWKAGLKDFRGGNRYQFLSYLKLITVNEAKTYIRLTAGHAKEISVNENPNSGDAQLTEFDSHMPEPEETTSARERLTILAGYLRHLTLEHQQIFLMKAIGYKEKEIAEILGIPQGTVASTYSRIVDRLKSVLIHD